MVELGPGEDSSDSPSSIDDYLNEDADGVLARVDFKRMFMALGGGILTALLSFFAGSVLAIRTSVGNAVDDVESAASSVWQELLLFPQRVQEESTRVAVEELARFDLFAGPASALLLVAVFLVIAIIVGLFVWGDL